VTGGVPPGDSRIAFLVVVIPFTWYRH